MTRPRPYYCTHSQSRKLTKNPNDGKCQRTAYEHYPLDRRRIAEYSTRRSTYRPPEQRKQRLSGFGLLTLLAPSTKFRYILFRHTSFYPPNNRPQFSLSHRRNYEPTCETNLPTKVPPRIRLVDLFAWRKRFAAENVRYGSAKRISSVALELRLMRVSYRLLIFPTPTHFNLRISLARGTNQD